MTQNRRHVTSIWAAASRAGTAKTVCQGVRSMGSRGRRMVGEHTAVARTNIEACCEKTSKFQRRSTFNASSLRPEQTCFANFPNPGSTSHRHRPRVFFRVLISSFRNSLLPYRYRRALATCAGPQYYVACRSHHGRLWGCAQLVQGRSILQLSQVKTKQHIGVFYPFNNH